MQILVSATIIKELGMDIFITICKQNNISLTDLWTKVKKIQTQTTPPILVRTFLITDYSAIRDGRP